MLRNSALSDYAHDISYNTTPDNANYGTFNTSNFSEIFNAVITALGQYPAVKLYFRSERYTVDGTLQSTTAGFQSFMLFFHQPSKPSN